MSSPEASRPPIDYQTLVAAYDRAWRQFQTQPTHHNRVLLAAGKSMLMQEFAKPGKFEFGQTVATPGSLEVLTESGHLPVEFLLRHKRGDWGDLDPEDRRENERALRLGGRLLSAYSTRLQDRL